MPTAAFSLRLDSLGFRFLPEAGLLGLAALFLLPVIPLQVLIVSLALLNSRNFILKLATLPWLFACDLLVTLAWLGSCTSQSLAGWIRLRLGCTVAPEGRRRPSTTENVPEQGLRHVGVVRQEGLPAEDSVSGPSLAPLAAIAIQAVAPVTQGLGAILSGIGYCGGLLGGFVFGLVEPVVSMGNSKSKVEAQSEKIDHPLQLALAKFVATEGREMSVEMLEETTTLLQLAMNTCIKTKERKAAWVCRICLDQEIRVLLKPCRHACLCGTCSDLVEICPICRMQITGREKFILS
ncbi:hypothetical protein KFL_002260120 [Klebsormidium nitens]|uniref:RING-type domain-containing protein n=1 Tax=Klebsormidium nitens TaxID=105231 RepID=A0A1Y1I991_KLENI|nr:hypothetical protein KFL_002260120 [Klebsormidium nitens]|eukprot:GAQ85256.1 hypothetical protein KFL_002260120 [Klebsormidium nitens]